MSNGYTKYDLTRFDFSTLQGNAKDRLASFVNVFQATIGAGRTVSRTNKFDVSVQADIVLYSLKKRVAVKFADVALAIIKAGLNTYRNVSADGLIGSSIVLSKYHSPVITLEENVLSSVMLSKKLLRGFAAHESISALIRISKNMHTRAAFDEIVNGLVKAASFRVVHMIISARMMPGEDMIIDSDMANVFVNGESVVDKYDGDEFVFLTNRLNVMQITPLGGGTLEGIIVYNEGWL